MNAFTIALISITLLTSGKSTDPRIMAAADLKLLQGTWERTSMEIQGEPAASDATASASYSGDLITLIRQGAVYRKGIVTLDPSQSPKATNTWDLDGPYKDQTVPGIYRVTSDTLEVCFSRPGEPRPMEFTTKKGSGVIYVVYRKKK
jgi:uncharacterized protein (TIGR03067 family)